MSEEEQEEVVCPPEGLPAYMGTFADLMALLMCFFVLLLSFSEMDVQKYKQVAGSMAAAFGVQNQVKAKDIPKGTSVIAQEFSPGKPQPTLITVVMQQTIDTDKQTLDFTDKQGKDDGDGKDDAASESDESSDATIQINKTFTITSESKEPTEETEALAMEVAKQMADELDSGQIELVAQGNFLKFRIREKGSFSSGYAKIQKGFLPVLAKIRDIIKESNGRVSVAGHTDNRPMYTKQYPSNWELSSARAATVARELLSTNELDRNRFHVIGHADTLPIRDNDTRENRAYNRRVEIIIVQGEQALGSEIGIKDNKPDPQQPEVNNQ